MTSAPNTKPPLNYYNSEFEKYLAETISQLKTELIILEHLTGYDAYLADDGSLDTIIEVVDKDEYVQTFRFEGSSIFEVFSFDYPDEDIENCSDDIVNTYRILSCMVDALEHVKANGFQPDEVYI